MPQPRKARRKHPANGTRASRRHTRDSEWVLAKLQERFDRFAELYELKRQQEEAAGDIGHTNQEKAPGLAAEGSIFFQEKGRTSG
jgi:hypothetical protein